MTGHASSDMPTSADIENAWQRAVKSLSERQPELSKRLHLGKKQGIETVPSDGYTSILARYEIVDADDVPVCADVVFEFENELGRSGVVDTGYFWYVTVQTSSCPPANLWRARLDDEDADMLLSL